MPEFHAEAIQATVSAGFAQGLYVAARAGVEPTILQTKGLDSTNSPLTPHNIIQWYSNLVGMTLFGRLNNDYNEL